MAKTKPSTLMHSGTGHFLMGPEAEAMLRDAAAGQPARARHNDTQTDQLTRSWLTRNGWIDGEGLPTPKAEQALKLGQWPPKVEAPKPRDAPAGFSS
jgi:hypothetical protein